MGKTRQHPGPPGKILNLKLNFICLMFWICFINFVKLESSIVKNNRSVSVLGQQGVACSHTSMSAILDHSLGGVIFGLLCLLFSFFHVSSCFLNIFDFLYVNTEPFTGRHGLFLLWVLFLFHPPFFLHISDVLYAQGLLSRGAWFNLFLLWSG